MLTPPSPNPREKKINKSACSYSNAINTGSSDHRSYRANAMSHPCPLYHDLLHTSQGSKLGRVAGGKQSRANLEVKKKGQWKENLCVYLTSSIVPKKKLTPFV